jgi:predicted amidohydrolase YtcJ
VKKTGRGCFVGITRLLSAGISTQWWLHADFDSATKHLPLAKARIKVKADHVYVDGIIYPGPTAKLGTLPSQEGDVSLSEFTSMAVTGARVVAIGTKEEILALAGPDTRVFDLGGRRVVPGLIDGHMHAVRAGANWDQELHWTDVTQLSVALQSIRDTAARIPAGEWIRVIGGWHPSQFDEQRAPTRDELDRAGGQHPVYVQSLYEEAVLNTAGIRAAGIDALMVDPPGGEIDRLANGEPTGVLRGMGAFTHCLAAMGSRSTEAQRVSTAVMLGDLHAKGLTGIVDPGGFGMPPESYAAVSELWRQGGLTMRMRLFASAVKAGSEFDELDEWLRGGRDEFDDDMLRLIGIGEVVHYGCHDFEGLDTSFSFSDTAREELLAISRRTAQCGWPMHIHAVLDSSIDAILDCWEIVNKEFPLQDLRFTVVHADAISPRNIERLAELGAGVVVDDHLIFKAALSQVAWGEESIRRAPPLQELLQAGVPVAAGTDANRASSYNPWLVLWWLVAGRSLDGIDRRSANNQMSREEALAAYTLGSARLSFEEDERGHLGPGTLADFAVLSADYFKIPIEDVPAITSELTVVGGRHVHSSGAIAAVSNGRESLRKPS